MDIITEAEAIRLLLKYGYRIQRKVVCKKCDGDGFITVESAPYDWTTSCAKYEWEEVKITEEKP